MTIAKQLNISEDNFPFIIKDKNGKEIYYEDSNGFWYKQEFDSNSNLTHYKNSDGFWVKREYNSNGNETYHENSNGFWVKKEFDSNGNRTYFENSDGVIKGTKHNNTTNLDGKTVTIENVDYKLKIK